MFLSDIDHAYQNRSFNDGEGFYFDGYSTSDFERDEHRVYLEEKRKLKGRIGLSTPDLKYGNNYFHEGKKV